MTGGIPWSNLDLPAVVDVKELSRALKVFDTADIRFSVEEDDLVLRSVDGTHESRLPIARWMNFEGLPR